MQFQIDENAQNRIKEAQKKFREMSDEDFQQAKQDLIDEMKAYRFAVPVSKAEIKAMEDPQEQAMAAAQNDLNRESVQHAVALSQLISKCSIEIDFFQLLHNFKQRLDAHIFKTEGFSLMDLRALQVIVHSDMKVNKFKDIQTVVEYFEVFEKANLQVYLFDKLSDQFDKKEQEINNRIADALVKDKASQIEQLADKIQAERESGGEAPARTIQMTKVGAIEILDDAQLKKLKSAEIREKCDALRSQLENAEIEFSVSKATKKAERIEEYKELAELLA